MKHFAFVAVVVLTMLARPASGVVRDVLARASGDRMWVARVVAETTERGSVDQTIILIRASGPGQEWKTLAVVPARVIGLASRSSQLVALLSNGSWQSIWAPDGASTGQALPGGGQIRAISDDGDSLWAVGIVRGGIGAATRAAVTTHPSSLPSAEQAIPADAESTLVLFQQQAGVWQAVGELPPHISIPLTGPTASVSLAIVAGQPYVAVAMADGLIHTLAFDSEQHWRPVSVFRPAAGETFVNFELLSAENAPMLWVNDGKGAGKIYPNAADQSPIALKWNGDPAPDSNSAITSAGGYLRLIALRAGKLYEQRYDPDGKPVGTAAELAVPATLSGTAIEYWVNGALIVALTFSIFATLYRRTLLRRGGRELNPPPPAPLLLRGGAGLVDLLPLIVGALVVFIHTDSSRDPQERLEDLPALFTLGASIFVYLLHTTLVELFTGRTAGKWVFGLVPVSLDGTSPTSGQVVVRNILRVLDVLIFPLMLVIISPLRQRSADIAAGTLVARAEDVKTKTPESKSAERPMDGPGAGPDQGPSTGGGGADSS